jgi:DNA repair protein RecN (Recombination protein N)
MIKQILIKNYILIDELLVKLDRGLNIITGETGAGKSIIINAIDLIFSSRVSKEIIKKNCEKALIEIILENNKSEIKLIFDENGIDNFENEIIISKEISQTTVRTRVNGTLVNQDFIKILKDKFLDIHSQNQAYSLLQTKYHINLIDSYAKESYGRALSEYKSIFTHYQSLCLELESAKSLAKMTENQIEFLKFQLDEIHNAQITDENEYETLKNELKILENVEKLKELTGSAYWGLSGDENSIMNALGQIKMNISKACQMDESLSLAEENLILSIENLQEISALLRDYSQNLDNDTEKMNLIQERIFLLDKLKRKYGNSLADVIKNFEHLKNEYEQIEFSTQHIEKLETDIKNILAELHAKAENISQVRKDVAQRLSSLIEDNLEKLELPKVRFKIAINPCELNHDGIDKVEFLISTNISEDLKPIAKVASGGEVSRIMLAIKTIFAQNDEIDTVIFDEIDAGISGKTSQSVADAIVELAKFHQIILITHQPIIASKADKHFYIKKLQNEALTQIGVYVLNGENRIKALAELAGGEINEQSIEFARSLVQ